MKKKPQFIAYYRVSTQKQKKSGLGLKAQRSLVLNYVESVSGEVVADYEEHESGSNSQRPELLTAINEAKKRKAILLIAKLDRLARDVEFISRLINTKGLEFRCCDFPDANKVMLQMLSVFAEWERDQISKRTKEALKEAKRKGVKLGAKRPDIKRMNQRRKTQADKFAARLKPTIQSYSRSGMSQRKIVQTLDEVGIKSFFGGKIHLTQLQRIISRFPKV